MSTFYFFSGFDPQKGFPQEIAKELKRDIKQTNSIVYITTSPYNHNKTDKYAKATYDWFKNIGLVFNVIYIIDDRKSENECKNHIKEASCLFLAGGNPITQLEFIKNNDLDKYIREFDGVIMGMSAGAMNMGKTALYSKDKHYDKTFIYEGLNLADITIEPHFDIVNATHVDNELYPISNEIKIYAMCDDSAIIVRNDRINYIGEIYYILKNKIVKLDRVHENSS